MPGFDVEGAQKAGYSEDEIIQHLTATRKFDVDGARKAGYSNSEIIDHLKAAPQSGGSSAPAKKYRLELPNYGRDELGGGLGIFRSEHPTEWQSIGQDLLAAAAGFRALPDMPGKTGEYIRATGQELKPGLVKRIQERVNPPAGPRYKVAPPPAPAKPGAQPRFQALAPPAPRASAEQPRFQAAPPPAPKAAETPKRFQALTPPTPKTVEESTPKRFQVAPPPKPKTAKPPAEPKRFQVAPPSAGSRALPAPETPKGGEGEVPEGHTTISQEDLSELQKGINRRNLNRHLNATPELKAKSQALAQEKYGVASRGELTDTQTEELWNELIGKEKGRTWDRRHPDRNK